MLKRIISLGILLVLILSLSACNINANADLDDLKRRISDLETNNSLSDDKIRSLEEQNNNLNGKIEGLEAENKVLSDKIDELDLRKKDKDGVFYILEDDFENGLLTKNDIMHISYFKNGSVYEVIGETLETQKVDFVPQKDTPVLDPKIEAEIKRIYYENNRNEFDNHGYGVQDVKILNFWGEYNGNYAIEITADFWDYPQNIPTVCVDGIIWTSNYPLISIFTYC